MHLKIDQAIRRKLGDESIHETSVSAQKKIEQEV